jgi:hypothetical protein
MPYIFDQLPIYERFVVLDVVMVTLSKGVDSSRPSSFLHGQILFE